MLFPEAPAPYGKKKIKQFLLHCTSICLISKSMPQIFKILFPIGCNNIFVLPGVFCSSFVQLKSTFSDEKNINGEIRNTFW